MKDYIDIENHLLKGNVFENEIKFYPTPNQGGTIKPSLIVIHHTGGSLAKFNSVKYLQNSSSKASAHIVIEYDGTISQMVAFNKKAWHAGVSSYNGVKNVNDFSIGIEIVNPGKLNSEGKSYFGTSFKDYELKETSLKESPYHGAGLWLPFSKEQESSLITLCKELCKNYKIENIVGHYDIAPGRKFDPIPLFNFKELKEIVFGRNCSTSQVRNIVNLNLRSLRNLSKDSIIDTIPKNTPLEVLKFQFDENNEKWFLVEVVINGVEKSGWVLGEYLNGI